MKIQTKGLTSLLMAGCFSVVSVSGIVMYLTPKGQVANWTNWTMLGLGKEEWGAIHINACLLFLILSIFHWFLNWNVFWSYIKKRAGTLNLKFEMLITVMVTVLIVVGTVLQVPPFSTVMAWNDNIKTYWAQKTPAGPVPHAEDFSIERFSRAIGLPLEDVSSALRQEGFDVADSQITMAMLAKQKDIAPSDVYLAIQKHFPADLQPVRGRGLGKKKRTAN